MSDQASSYRRLRNMLDMSISITLLTEPFLTKHEEELDRKLFKYEEEIVPFNEEERQYFKGQMREELAGIKDKGLILKHSFLSDERKGEYTYIYMPSLAIGIHMLNEKNLHIFLNLLTQSFLRLQSILFLLVTTFLKTLQRTNPY